MGSMVKQVLQRRNLDNFDIIKYNIIIVYMVLGGGSPGAYALKMKNL